METKSDFEYSIPNKDIRYKIVSLNDIDEQETPVKSVVWRFEVFKRPYFFGRIGKKRWCKAGDWVTYEYGYDWCVKILNRQIYK